MKMKYKKTLRVMNDLMGYCYYLGAQDIHVDFSIHQPGADVTVQAAVPSIDKAKIDELSQLLNMPRQREVEQNYWNISGEEQLDNELTLAAMMVDSAEVSYDNGTLTIHVHRTHTSLEE